MMVVMHDIRIAFDPTPILDFIDAQDRAEQSQHHAVLTSRLLEAKGNEEFARQLVTCAHHTGARRALELVRGFIVELSNDAGVDAPTPLPEVSGHD